MKGTYEYLKMVIRNTSIQWEAVENRKLYSYRFF